MSESIEVPDFEFEQDDYVIHWEGDELARIEYMECQYPSERWWYQIECPRSHDTYSVEKSKFEDRYQKVVAPRCPACEERARHGFDVEVWRCCADDCPVDEFSGEEFEYA